jgi:hypothetical protein
MKNQFLCVLNAKKEELLFYLGYEDDTVRLDEIIALSIFFVFYSWSRGGGN